MIYIINLEHATNEEYLEDFLKDNEIVYKTVDLDKTIGEIVNNTNANNDQMFIVRFIRKLLK